MVVVRSCCCCCIDVVVEIVVVIAFVVVCPLVIEFDKFPLNDPSPSLYCPVSNAFQEARE